MASQPEKRENSVLFSLRELRSIEESRVKEEEDATRSAEEARIRAKMDEERRLRETEEAKQRATLEQARLEREAAEARVREEAMRIQEAEARARADHQAQLEASRLHHEMEIRKTEASKKRPVALVVAMLIFAAITVGAVLFMVQRSNEKERAEAAQKQAEEDREKADAIAKQKSQETADLKAQLESLSEAVELLDKQMAEADRQLASATNEADRQKVRERQAAINASKREAQARINKVRAGVKLKCPPDQPLC